MRNEQGGVTVFALIALSVLIVLFAVLGDLARINIAKAEAEEAARRTGRSLLARFDPNLLSYGLFGTEWNDSSMDEVVSALIEANLFDGDHERFTLYAPELEWPSFTADPLYHLGDHRVFERQVLERMKYVAGIEFAVEVTQKFARGNKEIVQAEQYVHLSADLERLIRLRGRALDQAWTIAQSIVDSALAFRTGVSLQSRLDQLHRSLETAEKHNDEIREKWNAYEQDKSSGMELPPIVVYPSTFFSEYKSAAGTIASLHAAWRQAQLELNALAMAGLDPNANHEWLAIQREALGQQIDKLRKQLRQYASEWKAARSEEESERQAREQDIRREQEEAKQQANREISKRLERMKNVCSPKYAMDYRALTAPDGLYEKYRTYNEHVASEGMQPDIPVNDAEGFLFDAIRLTKMMADAATQLRDEVYMNEYALSHFTYRTYDRDAAAVTMGNRNAHRLEGQEAEFILYGLPDCWMNLGAMEAELFVFRTGLRTIEALMKPGTAAAAASPLTALLKALAEGVVKASRDVEELLAGEAVELPLIRGLTMNYKDHLRLFYLLHSNDAAVMSRMQALIEWNTGADLMERYTAVRVRNVVAPRSFLLPPRREEAEAVVSYS